MTTNELMHEVLCVIKNRQQLIYTLENLENCNIIKLTRKPQIEASIIMTTCITAKQLYDHLNYINQYVPLETVNIR